MDRPALQATRRRSPLPSGQSRLHTAGKTNEARPLANGPGLEDTADSSQILNAAKDSVARWRSFANSGGTSDIEERICRVVYRSFERLAGDAGVGDLGGGP